jgi:hypothetical protein
MRFDIYCSIRGAVGVLPSCALQLVDNGAHVESLKHACSIKADALRLSLDAT